MAVSVKIDFPEINSLLRNKGLLPGGDAQTFVTQNVLRRIQKFMPFRSGLLIKLMVAQTDITVPRIVLDAPQAQYLYYGKLMVDPITGKGAFFDPKTDRFWSRPGVAKVLSGRDLTYTTTANPQAGPYWDRALVAAEMGVMTEEFQAYIDRRG